MLYGSVHISLTPQGQRRYLVPDINYVCFVQKGTQRQQQPAEQFYLSVSPFSLKRTEAKSVFCLRGG